MSSSYSYLAFGDSYTIGEQVLLKESFPFLTIDILNELLKSEGRMFGAPKVIAQTGWTTDELQAAIDSAGITGKYDFVSLLIGVNNQYRGCTVEHYKFQFEKLLHTAMSFANEKKENVFVLSIPDWGTTPFAEGRDRDTIAKQIDEFNAAAKNICGQHGVVFIDITTGQRKDAGNSKMLAADGLHPSGKEYAKWAALLAAAIEHIL
jgi:lysophospholipase L1-like esterase